MNFKLDYYIEKIMILLMVILLYSYSLEYIIFDNLDITIMVFIFQLLAIIYLILITNKIIEFNIPDFFIIILISYVLLHVFLYGNYRNGFLFIASSITPYFLGRYSYINKFNYTTFRKLINISALITIIYLVIQSLETTGFNRGHYGLSPVGLGELITIFIIVNLYNISEFNLDKKSSFFILIGFFTLAFLLGSRGAFLSTIITIFIVSFLKFESRKRKKLLFYIIIFIAVYFLVFNVFDSFINEIPTLRRFSIYNIINDPSVVGNNKYLGRLGLYKNSVDLIYELPIFGHGLGIIYAHNIFLEFITALGLIGFVLFILWLLSILINIIEKFKIKPNYVLIALFIQSFIYKQTSFSYLAYKTLFIFGGMLISFYNEKD